MTGCFNKSAITGLCATLRLNDSVECRRLICPDDDLATIAACLRRSIDGGGRIDADRGCSRYREGFQRSHRNRRYGGIAFSTADIATNQNLAATGLPGSVDRRRAELY